jgi:adenylate kinase
MLAPVRLVLLGPPGSGKGTQGPAIAERLRVPYMSTGDVLRDEVAEGTELGRHVGSLMERGDLVPDDVMLAVVVAGLTHHGTTTVDGYVLDGFPRTLAQAEMAEAPDSALAPPEVAVLITLTPDVVHERLELRAEEGRPDDADPAVIDRRLEVYAAESGPLLDHYRDRGVLVTVDGDQKPDEVTAAIVTAVERHLGLA